MQCQEGLVGCCPPLLELLRQLEDLPRGHLEKETQRQMCLGLLQQQGARCGLDQLLRQWEAHQGPDMAAAPQRQVCLGLLPERWDRCWIVDSGYNTHNTQHTDNPRRTPRAIRNTHNTPDQFLAQWEAHQGPTDAAPQHAGWWLQHTQQHAQHPQHTDITQRTPRPPL